MASAQQSQPVPASVVPQTTSGLYRWVIDDVIAKIKPEVVQEGLDESLLDELRSLWEAKLVEKGVLDSDQPAQPAPASGASGSVPGLPPNLNLSPAQFAQLAAAAAAGNPNVLSVLSAHPTLAAALAAHIHQQQAQQQAQQVAQAAAALQSQQARASLLGVKREAPDSGFAAAVNRGIPQRDGAADDEDEDDDEDEEQEGVKPEVKEETKEEVNNEEEDDEDPLSSGDDEENDDEDDEENIQDFLCCAVDKVSRAKNKWKVQMKDGVFHINGKDYLFKRAQGEFIF